MIIVSVCLPSDALLQHPPSYLGFSCLGHRVSLHGCSSKAQPLLFTLDEGYLLTAIPPDIERGVAPLGPPAPAQPPLLGCGVAPLGCCPWPRTWGSSSWPPPLGHGVLPVSAPDLGRGVVLWPPHAKSWLIGKDSDAGRDWGQEEKGTEDEMAGWYHRLDRRESEWTLGVGDGQGGLACCDSWGCKESDTTERLNWTELNWTEPLHLLLFSHCHAQCFATPLPGLPVPPYFPEFAQVHVHWVGDAIQPSHPLLPSSPFAFNLSQGLFQWVGLLHYFGENQYVWKV